MSIELIIFMTEIKNKKEEIFLSSQKVKIKIIVKKNKDKVLKT